MGELVYLDSSAIVKLVVREKESAALRRFLESHPRRITSVLAVVEVHRAVRRAGAPLKVRRRASDVVAGLALLVLDDAIVQSAAVLKGRYLRALDAIHLASALSLEADLDCMVAYDDRLARAAAEAGVKVEAPAPKSGRRR